MAPTPLPALDGWWLTGGWGAQTVARRLLKREAMQRILFVDDEQHVLDGLRNLLRARRREWDMRFACGGEAAFALLASETFDVVVSDMCMPRYDGATVLERARDLQPRAVRIVLSAQSEPETAMKAVFVAHRFVAKPCDPIALQDIIQQACHRAVGSRDLEHADGVRHHQARLGAVAADVDDDLIAAHAVELSQARPHGRVG